MGTRPSNRLSVRADPAVLVSLSLVGDSYNHVLRMIDARTDTITAIAGGISGSRQFAFVTVPSHPRARWTRNGPFRAAKELASPHSNGSDRARAPVASGPVLVLPPVEDSEGAKGVPS